MVKPTAPTAPVTMTPEEIEAFAKRFSTFRHDVNNHLMLISASAEIIQLYPEQAANYLKNIIEQPQKITEAMKNFTVDFERALGQKRP